MWLDGRGRIRNGHGQAIDPLWTAGTAEPHGTLDPVLSVLEGAHPLMCGIAGVFDPAAATTADVLRRAATCMADTLRHRGPDDHDVWVDGESGVALGHRRLAILDLSDAGHQPMASESGRYVVSYNGELYNEGELRARLEATGRRFRGHCDTEVLLAAIEEWGLEPALQRTNGMFAFALWDGRERVVHLVRDRLGEKPLFYGWAGDVMVFGSELKALVAHPSFRPELDRDVLVLYLRLGYVPAPHCIYRRAAKLPAGGAVTFAAGARPGAGLPAARSWWRFGKMAAGAASRRSLPGAGNGVGDEELLAELERVLLDAVGLRLHADVPVGAFLSGGIDSSTVVALAQQRSSSPVRTFTVGFAGTSVDESDAAAAVARHLGTDHTEMQLSPSDVLDLVPRLSQIYDEPFADPSQIPTALISGMARHHVVVCLSGDGGDEVFGGYNRYTLSGSAYRQARRLPTPARDAARRALTWVSPITVDRAFGRIQGVLPSRLQLPNPGDKVQKLAGMLDAGTPQELFCSLVSHWPEPVLLVPGAAEARSLATGGLPWPDTGGLADQMMLADSVTTLPDQMLAKVDRASMEVALEVRVPLLDHRVVELAWALPPSLRVSSGQGKQALRKILHRYVPPALLDRPKLGFDPPVAGWLRGPLRSWAEELLDPARLAAQGVLDVGVVSATWSEHVAGRRNWDYRLWGVLMFQSWLERWGAQT